MLIAQHCIYIFTIHLSHLAMSLQVGSYGILVGGGGLGIVDCPTVFAFLLYLSFFTCGGRKAMLLQIGSWYCGGWCQHWGLKFKYNPNCICAFTDSCIYILFVFDGSPVWPVEVEMG